MRLGAWCPAAWLHLCAKRPQNVQTCGLVSLPAPYHYYTLAAASGLCLDQPPWAHGRHGAVATMPWRPPYGAACPAEQAAAATRLDTRSSARDGGWRGRQRGVAVVVVMVVSRAWVCGRGAAWQDGCDRDCDSAETQLARAARRRDSATGADSRCQKGWAQGTGTGQAPWYTGHGGTGARGAGCHD